MDVAIRCIGMDPLQMVAGGRYELYSAYPIRVSAVPASVFRDAMRRFATSCIRVRQENRHTQVLPGPPLTERWRNWRTGIRRRPGGRSTGR